MAGQAVDTADPIFVTSPSSSTTTTVSSSPSKDVDYPSNRKLYFRSATWTSRSAPASPRTNNQATTGAMTVAPSIIPPPLPHPLIPVLERQASNKARASLPPLQPLTVARRSLEHWPKAASDDLSITDWSTPSTPGRRRVKTGPDIKIDLASVQRGGLEPTEIQLKRDKFAFFDKECSRVSESHIYLGSDAVAKNLETLKANGITHVLNCVGFVCPEYFKKDFVYKTLWLQDSPGEDITSLLYDVFDYFEEVREQGGRVFVHCCQGVSRSTSLVIAYMMWRDRLSFEDAFQDVKASRGVTNPNMGFACQLLQCQKRVHAAPMSPNSILRMYRLAPHSPYDPLHLVPKMVNNPGPGALDSRGAFVIHVPLAIYVWIGVHCDPKISRAARMAAEQVIRYERVRSSPPIIVTEASENPVFWDALSKYANDSDDRADDIGNSNRSGANNDRKEGSVDKSVAAGDRIVNEYSADFELFQRAKQGGVVPPVPSTGLGVVVPPTRIPAREDGWCRLRRKFISGELLPSRESSLVSKENLETSTGSPNPSLESCSPNFSSPFSSSSSSDNAGSCDSPFASPLSHLSISSPNMPIFYTPHTFEVDAMSGFSTPKGGRDQGLGFPSNRRTPPPMLNSKLPSILLARRRGDATAHSHSHEDSSSSTSADFIALGDPSRDSNSRFDEGTPMVEKESFDENMAHEKDGPEFKFASSSSNNRLMAILKSGHPALYAWPRVERIDMFDVDDLDSKAVFVLILPRATQEYVVYVWIGRDCTEQKENDELYWQSIARKFLQQLECGECVNVRVVKQGHEPEEFWDNFNRG